VVALTPVYQAITRHALKAVAQQRNSRNSRLSRPEPPSNPATSDRFQPS
jgi:hypothetical protein